jgi:hypothetical protein
MRRPSIPQKMMVHQKSKEIRSARAVSHIYNHATRKLRGNHSWHQSRRLIASALARAAQIGLLVTNRLLSLSLATGKYGSITEGTPYRQVPHSDDTTLYLASSDDLSRDTLETATSFLGSAFKPGIAPLSG